MSNEAELDRLVESRVHRILQPLARYRQIRAEDGRPSCPYPTMRVNERLLGMYDNCPGEADGVIVVTNMGFHLQSCGNWISIYFDQLSHVETPAVDEKMSVERLQVVLKSGERVTIPIRGGTESFRDAWEFVRFLNRVIGDIRRRS